MCVCNPNIRTPWCGKEDCTPSMDMETVKTMGKMFSNEYKPPIIKTFEDICVDDDMVNILEFLYSLFEDGKFTKRFEITVSAREIDYDEEGETFYVE